jgi:hypothetical protein
MNFFLGTVVRSSAGFHVVEPAAAQEEEEATGLMADKFGFAFDAAVPGASVQRALDNIFGAVRMIFLQLFSNISSQFSTCLDHMKYLKFLSHRLR